MNFEDSNSFTDLFGICIINSTGLDLFPTLYDKRTCITTQLEICQFSYQNKRLYYNKIKSGILGFDKVIIINKICDNQSSPLGSLIPVLSIDLDKLERKVFDSKLEILLLSRKNGEVEHDLIVSAQGYNVTGLSH